MATLTGGNLDETLVGGVAADLISGLGGNDSLTGNEGDDTLHGGKGADTLEGNIGNDSYVVDNAGDVIVETGGDFRDRILASVSVDLNNAAYAGVENVTLLGAASLTATGNAGANMLIGNTGANTIEGGAGFDTLAGAARCGLPCRRRRQRHLHPQQRRRQDR